MIILSLVKAFRILELISESDSGLTLTELVRHLRISMGAAQRITNTLLDLGYLERDPLTKHIRLTPKFLIFRSGYFSQTETRRICFPYMKRLNEQLDEVVHLGVMVNDEEISYIDRIDKISHATTTTFNIGDLRPIHFNSIGRVIMAFLPEPDLQRILDRIPFAKNPSKSFKNKSDLMKELEKIRKQGYSARTSESHDDLYALTIPVLDYQQKAIAGISIIIPTSRLSMKDVHARYIPLMLETAQEITQYLGNTDTKGPMERKTKRERQI
jgi:DNA-binding IclR family transcriptional regulator